MRGGIPPRVTYEERDEKNLTSVILVSGYVKTGDILPLSLLESLASGKNDTAYRPKDISDLWMRKKLVILESSFYPKIAYLISVSWFSHCSVNVPYFECFQINHRTICFKPSPDRILKFVYIFSSHSVCQN